MKKRSYTILLTAVIACGIMALVDGIIQPGYAVKSAIKIALFLLLPFLVSRLYQDLAFKELFRFHKNGFFIALALGAGVYGLILGAYYLVKNCFDFSGIAQNLSQTTGVNKDNFLLVSLYISFVNSLLEEFFFRGFLFMNLRAESGRRAAYLFSSGFFAAYHVAMMIGWFSPMLFMLVMAGLMAGGMLFNFLNEKLESIYPSWLVHMCANFAINTIGFTLMA